MAHTPGPWTYDFDGRDGDGFVVRAPGQVEFNCVVNGELSRDFELDGPEHQQMKANVRLIAAAPELLDALIDIYAFVPGFLLAYGGKAGPDLQRWIDKAGAALSKANGI